MIITLQKDLCNGGTGDLNNYFPEVKSAGKTSFLVMQQNSIPHTPSILSGFIRVVSLQSLFSHPLSKSTHQPAKVKNESPEGCAQQIKLETRVKIKWESRELLLVRPQQSPVDESRVSWTEENPVHEQTRICSSFAFPAQYRELLCH